MIPGIPAADRIFWIVQSVFDNRENMKTRSLLGTIVLNVLFAMHWTSPDNLYAQNGDTTRAKIAASSLLFVGNSYTFGYGSPVRYYRSRTVTDLNGKGEGGVPALFKIFADEAGCDYAVFMEALPGKGLDFHLKEKSDVFSRSWNHVLLQDYSVLDKNKPGDPTLLSRAAKGLIGLLMSNNRSVDVRFVSTWSRADLTYPDSGYWHGKPIVQMALDIRKGYDRAAAECAPSVYGVIPVGEAWNRAMTDSVADVNPYDGISAGMVDLWSYDHYHGSAYGYYLSALTIFGDITGLDPRSLGKKERAAFELGFSAAQTASLQKVAFEELSATKGRPPLRQFIPIQVSEE